MSDNGPSEFLFEIFGTKVKAMSVAFLVLILIAGWFILRLFFSVEVPGQWNEKGSYETQVYVNLFPDKERTINYRLVADIERFKDCADTDEASYCNSWYFVKKITFPNSGYLVFDDCEVFLGKKVYCSDYHGESYYIELTNQKP